MLRGLDPPELVVVPRAPPDDRHVHRHRARHPRDRPADRAGAHDHEPRSRHARQRSVAPFVAPLQLDRRGQFLGEVEDDPERVLGDRPVEHAVGVREDHVRLEEPREEQLVDPSANALDPANPRRQRPGIHERGTAIIPGKDDLGLGKRPAELRLARGEPEVHPIAGHRRQHFRHARGVGARDKDDDARWLSHSHPPRPADKLSRVNRRRYPGPCS